MIDSSLVASHDTILEYPESQGALWDSDDMSMTVTDSLNTVRELVPNGACTSNNVYQCLRSLSSTCYVSKYILVVSYFKAF
jgi:hypothetical protein